MRIVLNMISQCSVPLAVLLLTAILGADPMKCYSFFKVGGGFKAEDYANIRHHTEGKWIDWDPKKPPAEFIELAGGDAQLERPDVWTNPCDSVVVCVKAASVGTSD